MHEQRKAAGWMADIYFRYLSLFIEKHDPGPILSTQCRPTSCPLDDSKTIWKTCCGDFLGILSRFINIATIII